MSKLQDIGEMFNIKVLAVVSCVLVFCDSAFVDSLKKCSSKDHACVKSVIQSVIHDTAKTGIPEYSIPPFDPFQIKNATVSALNVVDVTMTEGIAKGIKGCIVNKFEVELERGKATLDMTCNLKIKGKYKAYGSSDLIKNLLGGSSVRGDGSAKIVIDKLRMKFEYRFKIRSKDGDFFIDAQHDDIKYSSDIGKMTFALNNIYLGENESSGFIVQLLNDNWKTIMGATGKPFLDTAMDIIYEQTSKFFRVVPTKYYMVDDVSSYVTDE